MARRFLARWWFLILPALAMSGVALQGHWQASANAKDIATLEARTDKDHDTLTVMQTNIEWIVRRLGGQPKTRPTSSNP